MEGGEHKNVEGSQREHENILSYSTSNMHVITMTQPRNWGVWVKYFEHSRVGRDFYHQGIFQPASPAIIVDSSLSKVFPHTDSYSFRSS